jgi:hypothetical protein
MQVTMNNLQIKPCLFFITSLLQNEVNERIIELVSSIYGVNKVWLRTGKGQMFDKKVDSQLEEMTILFNQLNPHFKGYVLTQIKQLIKLQNIEKE